MSRDRVTNLSVANLSYFLAPFFHQLGEGIVITDNFSPSHTPTKYPNPNITRLPSDHLISDETTFLEKIKKGLDFVTGNDAIVTLGINPTRPDTGYGYIQYYTDLATENIFKVKTFTEKPTLEIAETFIQSGDFLWNAGIFVSSAKTWIDSFERYLPELHELFKAGKKFYYNHLT